MCHRDRELKANSPLYLLANGLLSTLLALTEATTSLAEPICAGSSLENLGCLALQSAADVEGLWVATNTLMDNMFGGGAGKSPSRAAKRDSAV